MKAAVCYQLGGPGVLQVEDLPDPVLSSGEVRLAVRAAGIGFQDSLMIAGKYQTKPEFPVCPGNEICGDVIELGPRVSELCVGDRVVALLQSGGYADKAVIPAASAVPVQKEADPNECAVLGMAYGTAYQALVDRAAIKQGEFLLIRGAGGGVGFAAAQVGLALGAQVIATASSPQRRELLKSAGVLHVLDSNDPAFREAVLRITERHGCDVIFDPVGIAFREQVLRCVAWRGRILIIGFAGGEIPQIPAHYILNKFCSVIGVMWGHSFFLQEPEKYRDILHSVIDLYAAGAVRPHISKVVSLRDAASALTDLIENRAQGRAVVSNPGSY